MRILIVDDHPLFREALSVHLESIYPGSSVFEAASIAEAMGVIRLYGHFDLIMLDVSLPDARGVSGLLELRKLVLDTRIVVMSGGDDPDVAKDLVEKGAQGYIAKSSGGHEVKSALHLVLAGEIYISPWMLAGQKNPVLPSRPQDIASSQTGPSGDSANTTLTLRQRDVLRLMAKGLPNKLIARELNCSDGTVKLHVSAILRALHARNRTEAVQVAARIGVA